MNSNHFVCLIFYDVSTEQKAKVEYRKMRRHILINGFYMIQESVYARRGSDREALERFVGSLKGFEYEESNIKALVLTQNIFDNLITVTGEKSITDKLLDNTTFIVEI